MALSGHELPIPVLTLWKGDGEKKEKEDKWANMQHYLFFMFNHNRSSEAPLWEDFPEMALFMRYAMVYGVSWWNWKLWKFACCDR